MRHLIIQSGINAIADKNLFVYLKSLSIIFGMNRTKLKLQK
ncbi:hypothetical protein BQ1740_1111 [Bacillus subtilis]|nr:hypothetical protein BQ1740_1111 [Bacillus subtilis]